MTTLLGWPATERLDAWVASLGQACWQGGLLVLVVWAICRALRRMPARWQCWLWRLALLKFAVVLLVPTLVQVPLLPAPAPVVVPATPRVVQRVTPPQESPARPVAIPAPVVSVGPRWQTVLFSLWLLGAVASLVRWGNNWLAVRRLSRTGQALETGPTVELLANLRVRFPMRVRPRLRTIPGGGSPMLLGVWHPTIVFPADTLERLSLAEQSLVLAHELAHLRRGDLVWSGFGSLLRALFFFHPLFWFCQRQLHVAQEVAADALAIARQDYDPFGYGNLLVAVIGKLGWTKARSLGSAMSLEMAGARDSLTRRLVAMSRIGRTSRGMVGVSAVLLGFVALLGVLPWRLVAAEAASAVASPGVRYQARLGAEWRKQGKVVEALKVPSLIFPPGETASAVLPYPGQPGHYLLILVGSIPSESPAQHRMQILAYHAPDGEELTPEEKDRLVKLASERFTERDPSQHPQDLPKGSSITVAASSATTVTTAPSSLRQAAITIHSQRFLQDQQKAEFVLQSPTLLLCTASRGQITVTAKDGSEVEVQGLIYPAERPTGSGAEFEAAPEPDKANWAYYRIDAGQYGLVQFLDAAGERQIAGVDKKTGSWKWLEKAELDQIYPEPIASTEVAAFIQHGEPLKELIVYNGRLNKWSTYPLDSRVIDVVPCVGDRMVSFQLTDRIVAYSAAKDAWGVLRTEATPMVDDDYVFADTPEGRYQFPRENNGWSLVRRATP